MDNLLSAIVVWLSVNCGLAANHTYPRIEFVPPERMIALRYPSLLKKPAMEGTQGASSNIVALYDDNAGVIYLSTGWSAKTPAELSVLVHEMVHHLQKLNRMTYACPEERERLAFVAQERWLQAFGTTLEREFKIDPMTLLVLTQCRH